jgi:hypothetical protein
LRCHICNAVLTPNEINWNPDHEDWGPCNKCQEVIDEVFNDRSEDEIEQELNQELDLYGDDPEEKA